MNNKTWALILLCCLALAQQSNAQEQNTEMPPAYQEAIDSAYRAHMRGELAAAQERLQWAMDKYPKMPTNVHLLNNLAAIQLEQGRNEEALMSYSAAIELNPAEATIRQNRAMLLVEMGRTTDALLDFDELIQLYPPNEIYRYRRAMLYVALDRLNEAEADLTDILRENDASLKTREGLAIVKTRKGEYDEAERLFNYLIEKLPLKKCSSIYAGRARLFLAKGLNGFSLRDVGKAFEAAGKPNAELYALRGEINLVIGDKKAAEEDFALSQRMGYSAEAIAKLKASKR